MVLNLSYFRYCIRFINLLSRAPMYILRFQPSLWENVVTLICLVNFLLHNIVNINHVKVWRVVITSLPYTFPKSVFPTECNYGDISLISLLEFEIVIQTILPIKNYSSCLKTTYPVFCTCSLKYVDIYIDLFPFHKVDWIVQVIISIFECWLKIWST